MSDRCPTILEVQSLAGKAGVTPRSGATERWRLAGWLGGVSPLRVTKRMCRIWLTGGETPPGQPARRQRSV